MIVRDAAGNMVRQGYCYTCLAMGGYFGRVTQGVLRSGQFWGWEMAVHRAGWPDARESLQSGEGKLGRTKYRRIPKCEGDEQE